MNMNGINPALAGKAAQVYKPVEVPPPAGADKQPVKQGGDRIELSEEARRLLANSAASDSPRQAIIEAARAKLQSGQLTTPEAIEKAAEKMLRSGALGAIGDEPVQ